MSDLPHGRLLSSTELRAVTRTFANDPDRWADQVRHESDQRVFEQIHLDQHLGVWLICWMDGHDTGFHDHDISAGAFTVARGKLREERLRFGAPASSVTLDAGEGTQFEPTDIHRVLHEGHSPAVSIHAYSPPLVRMGSYLVEPDGALKRQPMGPVEELRALAA